MGDSSSSEKTREGIVRCLNDNALSARFVSVLFIKDVSCRDFSQEISVQTKNLLF